MSDLAFCLYAVLISIVVIWCLMPPAPRSTTRPMRRFKRDR